MTGGSRRNLRALAAVGLFVAGGAAACRREAPPAPDVVATVDAEEVRWEEFQRYLRRHLGDDGASLGSDVLSELFDQFLSERLLARLSVERGLVPEIPARARSGVSRRHAVDRLLAAAEPSGGPEIDAAAVAAYYDEHREDFRRPARVRLRQILVEDRGTADRALARIRAGTPFERVAAELEEDPEVAATAGPQGDLAREDLPPAFADAIFALAPGETSDVLQADYGFHLFQVVARLPAEVEPLGEARAEIERRLRQQATDRRLRELVEAARQRYDVTVFKRNLPFNYRGTYLDG